MASHTPLLLSAVEPFRAALEASGLRPATPVLAGIDGTPVLTRERAVVTLARQVATTVHWAGCARGLREYGVAVAVELPPGADLCKLVREAEPAIAVRAIAEFRSLDGLATWVGKQQAWSERNR